MFGLYNPDSKYVNVDGSHYPGGFGTNETSTKFGLPAMRDNISAASASKIKGGSLKRKIKNNVVNKYRMTKTKMRGRKFSLKNKLLSFFKRKGHKSIGHKKTLKRRSNRIKRGGNSLHNSGYSTGGVLSYKDLALANPVPFKPLTNCVTNYNYNTNKGTKF